MNEQPEFDFDAPPKKTAAEVSASTLDKIKKLLRLAGSANAHEAALAMKKAMEEADRHNLDLASLGDDEEVQEIIHRHFPTGKRVSREQRGAVAVARSYFNVTPCYGYPDRESVVLFGTEADIAVAEYVIEFLIRTCRECVRVYEKGEKEARRKTGGAKRINFVAGFFYGIHHQLGPRRDQLLLEHEKFAVVLRDQEAAREEAMHDLLGETGTVPQRKTRKNESAIMAGFREGKKTQLNAAIGTTGGRHLLS